MTLPPPERLRETGFDPGSPLLRRVLVLAWELVGFPRHLSQHPGGFVISEQPLSTLVPVENAAMDDRTVIQWDKDDLDAVGLLKVDMPRAGHAHRAAALPRPAARPSRRATWPWRRSRRKTRPPTT